MLKLEQTHQCRLEHVSTFIVKHIYAHDTSFDRTLLLFLLTETCRKTRLLLPKYTLRSRTGSLIWHSEVQGLYLQQPLSTPVCLSTSSISSTSLGVLLRQQSRWLFRDGGRDNLQLDAWLCLQTCFSLV